MLIGTWGHSVLLNLRGRQSCGVRVVDANDGPVWDAHMTARSPSDVYDTCASGVALLSGDSAVIASQRAR